MQKINYNESISLKSHISELILINIDEKLIQSKDSDCIIISGSITISGEANTINGKESFIHPIEVDITLSKDQLVNENAIIGVDDFDYILSDEKININLIIKIDGLKEIEPYFPPQEDQENAQIIELYEDTQLIDEAETLIDAEREIINNMDSNQETFIDENITFEEKQNQSLLSQIFKRKKARSSPCYLFHVVKQETTYKEIAELYNCNEELLKDINQDAKIYLGKLILIPKQSWRPD